MMLDETKADWFLVVDGNEIWWEESIRRVTETIRNEGNSLESIVVPTINVVGDIFHHLPENHGKYRLAGRKGHLALRAINRKIPGLASLNPHGTWGWVDENSEMIQDRNKLKIKFIDAPYIHTTHLPRAGNKEKELDVFKRGKKLKYDR